MRAICWSSLAGRRGNAARLLGTVLDTFAPYEYMNHRGTLIFVRVQREIQFDLTIGSANL
jgi:hypothetical protein